jgi:predicted nucleic acid-binding protein
VNKTTLILDSSVIAKWFIPETDNEKALLLKEKFTDNTISIAIPILLFYEINNILKTTTQSLRIDINEAIETYKAFLKLNFVAYSSEFLMISAIELALKFNISSYDASYIALAEYLQVIFLTADRKLLKKVSSKFILDINDYTLKK